MIKNNTYVYCSWTLRTSLLPTRATHGDVFSADVSGVVARCAQVCTSVFRCAQFVHVCRFRLCTVCTVCGMSLALTAVFSECFAKCAHICRMCRTLSQNSTRLGNKSTDRRSVRVSGKNSSGKDFSLGSKSEPWRRIRELFPSGAVRGRIWPDLAKSGAPAAILINAYSGDFCHPVLSNALAQEPLVYHSGTRELFSDIFGTFSEISTFSTFWQKTLKFANSVQNAKKHISQTRTLLQNVFTNAHKCKNISRHARKLLHMHKTQMHKSANVQKLSVHKMRKSAAHTFLQMQLSAQCTILQMQLSHFCRVHNFVSADFCVQIFFCVYVFNNSRMNKIIL